MLSTKSESVCLTKAMKRKKKEWKMAEGGQCTFHSIFLKYLYIINCCVLIRSSLWSSLKHGLILQFTHLYILFPLILVPRPTAQALIDKHNLRHFMELIFRELKSFASSRMDTTLSGRRARFASIA